MKLKQVLWIILWSVVGTFVGYSLYQVYHYHTRPEFYAMQSAPWYMGILVRGILTAAATVLLLLLLWIIKRGKCEK